MTAYMKFFPTGNADTTFIQLANNQVILLDYAHMRNAADPYDKRIDLPAAIREAMEEADQNSFRVVASPISTRITSTARASSSGSTMLRNIRAAIA